jgi:hypothetical protein
MTVVHSVDIYKDVDMPAHASAPLYRHHRAASTPPATAQWAITVQVDDDDPDPRILAYATAEHIANRICLALRQADRIARESNARSAATYADGSEAAPPESGDE